MLFFFLFVWFLFVLFCFDWLIVLFCFVLNHEAWGRVANVIAYFKSLKKLTWVRNHTLSLLSFLGKIMGKLIRD